MRFGVVDGDERAAASVLAAAQQHTAGIGAQLDATRRKIADIRNAPAREERAALRGR